MSQETENLISVVESLLFVSARPLALSKIAEAASVDEGAALAAVEELAREYRESGRGFEIVRNGKQWQMVSSSRNADAVRALLQDETSGELSRPSLGTLTIIAYRGPISKSDLDRLRGVNCSLILRNLLMRGLVEAKIRKDENFYSVSLDFIRFLGLGDLSSLPDYERLHKDLAVDRVLEPAAEPAGDSPEA